MNEDYFDDWKCRTQASSEDVLDRGAEMFTLWYQRDPSETPYKPQYVRQSAGEYRIHLCKLSRQNACSRTLGGAQQKENLPILRKNIHIQKGEGDNMQFIMCKQTGLEEKEIPRVSQGIEKRVDRLKAIGNGQVPQCVFAAWKILRDHNE